MWILILFLVILFFAATYAGQLPWFKLERLTRENVLNSMLMVLAAFTVLMIAYVLGFFPHWIAAPFMMSLYSLIAGFFTGYAVRMYRLRNKSGNILYQHRSFWIDHAPNFLSVILVLYGIYRSAILTDQAITGIRVTSGLSLIAFGIFMWTLKAVPEFRTRGILLLDRWIPWQQVITWNWLGESILSIEFLNKNNLEDGRIQQFATSIPEDERHEIESILKSKMEEYDEVRKEILFPE